jgi:1,4-alpha-glucan branching enzyme
MALDKFYGTSDKLKEFIDLCQNGIAVILDVALNHAFGRNPMVRMWMNDSDGDGWVHHLLKIRILIQRQCTVIV